MSDDGEFREFLRLWASKIDAWVRKTLAGQGASDAPQELRQAGDIAAWMAYLDWRALPDEERDQRTLDAIVTRRVKDAILDEWCRVSGRPRKTQRGSGARAELLRDYIADLARSTRRDFVRGRPDVMERAILQYQLELYGTLHGQTGLIDAETTMLRGDTALRIVFALAKLDDTERALIEGVYFQDRKLIDVAAELGIHSRPARSRFHLRTLDKMRHFMAEYASALGPHNTGGTLDNEPIGSA